MLLPGVEYVAGEKLTFDRYHSLEVIYHWMERWADEYPDIVSLNEIARSFEGRSVLQMTLTNRKYGLDTDKPAAVFEGNRHSGEITSAESVLWLAQYLN
ncbi:MAG: M14 family zinc carboxypeptidase [Bacteroidales bacterium]|nr:M14 family zinc carboxypeptidase [Bacteroidales bacterium]